MKLGLTSWRSDSAPHGLLADTFEDFLNQLVIQIEPDLP